MPGCFSRLFTTKKQPKHIPTHLKPTEDIGSIMSADTPFFCGSQAATAYTDKPPAYYEPGKQIFRPEVFGFIEERVDFYSPELRELSIEIHGKSGIGPLNRITD